MRSQKNIPPELLPDDDTLSPWQLCVKDAILYIQERWTHYKDGPVGTPEYGYSGSTEHIDYKGKRIMTANSPPTSHCCGAVLEVFLRSWKSWMGEDYETENDISKDAMWRMNRYTFLVPDPDSGRSMQDVIPGIAAGLQMLTGELDWLQVKRFTFTHEDYKQKYAPQFGDFLQMQFSEDGSRGHTVVVLGSGKHKGKNCLFVWSSNVGYDDEWEYSAHQKAGHGVDYYNIRSKRNGFTRVFHVARIVDED